MVAVADPIERARTLLELRRPDAAEKELRGLLAENPHHPAAHSFLALALLEQGGTAEAVTEAHEAVRLAPDHWFTHYVAGHVHYRLQRPDAAMAAVEASLALSPEHAPTWTLLSRTHMLAGRWPEMADAARRSLALDPETADPASLLALAHVAMDEAEPARAAAAQAVRLDPDSATAHLAYGRAALAFGDPREAADAFREVLRLDPGFGQARDLLVSALKQRNPLYRWLARLQSRYRGGWRLLLLLPAVPPVIAIFVLIALAHWAAWIAEAVTTLRLARAKATQLLFEGAEARVALLCCCLLALGATLLTLGITLGQETIGTGGAAVMALVTPVQEAAHTGSARARTILYGWTALLGLAITASMALSSLGPGMLSLYAALATIWVASGVRRVFGRDQTPV